MASNSERSVTTVKCKTVTTGPKSSRNAQLLNLPVVRNDWQGNRHASPLSPKSAVLSVDQSSVTAQAWPLDLHDITGTSEHASNGGGWILGGLFGDRGGVWVVWGWGGGGSQPGPEADVGDGWKKAVSLREVKRYRWLLKKPPIKRCPARWLHCQAAGERMHGGGHAEGHLRDKRHFFPRQSALQQSVSQWFCHFSSDCNLKKRQIYEVVQTHYVYSLSYMCG